MEKDEKETAASSHESTNNSTAASTTAAETHCGHGWRCLSANTHEWKQKPSDWPVAAALPIVCCCCSLGAVKPTTLLRAEHEKTVTRQWLCDKRRRRVSTASHALGAGLRGGGGRPFGWQAGGEATQTTPASLPQRARTR